MWEPPSPYADKNHPGRLTWRVDYIRGPTCTQDGKPDGIPLTEDEKDKEEDYNDGNDDEFWGRNRADKCCTCMNDGQDCIGDWQQDPMACQKPVNGRARLTSSEVGYYLDFGFDKNGLPKGCPEFDKEFKDYRPGAKKDASIPDNQLELLKLGKIDKDGLVNCEKQTKIKDETNKDPIWKTAELFAKKESLSLWHTEFLDSYEKMMTNGNKNLRKQSDIMPMAHGCECFKNGYNILSSGKSKNGNSLRKGKQLSKIKSAKECFDKCKTKDGCEEFLYKEHFQKCELFSELVKNEDTIQTNAHRFIVHGEMKNCREWTDEDFEKTCKVFM